MGGKSGPKAPSPQAQAEAQTKTNKETAYWNAVLNNVNQITPYGNLTYEQTGGGKQYNMDAYNTAMQNYQQALQAGATPAGGSTAKGVIKLKNNLTNGGRNSASGSISMPNLQDFYIGESPPQFTSTITLSPEQQAILDSQQRQDIAMGQLAEGHIGQIANATGSQYDLSGLQNQLPTADDQMQQQLRAEEAYMARLNPQFAQQEEALRTRLINQGIGQGSQAYQREMDSFNQMRNDALSQAVLAGQQYGGTAQNQALQRRIQEIDEYNAMRNAPINEYVALSQGQQVTNPQFQSSGYAGTQPFDISGAMRDYYSNQQAAHNNQQSAMGSLFGLGGSAIGNMIMPGIGGQVGGFLGSAVGGLFSDRRLKENITPVGEENGYPIYEFNYINIPEKRYVGVMAQDVEKIMPEAITESEGYKKVNYGMIGLEMREVA